MKLTRYQVRCQVIRLAKSLQELDVKEGDVIGICSRNCLEYPILTHATFCLGATIAPINPTYTDRKQYQCYLSRRFVLLSEQKISFH